MKQILLILSLFSIFSSIAQINKNGTPFITNYTPKQYKAAGQNWAIAQDQRGVMYFGNNNDGILEYDGVNWRKIAISIESVVRSINVDSLGIVYAGAVNDFGSLNVNNSGQIYYNSMRQHIDSNKLDFADIWNINIVNNGVFFGSENYIFELRNDSLKQQPIPVGSVQSFSIDTNIYIANFNEGLLALVKGKTELALGGDFFIAKGIYAMNKFKNKILIGTFPQGLYLYDPKDGSVSDYFNNSPANEFVKNYQLYPSSTYDSAYTIIGTIENGAIVIDNHGNITNHFNNSFGLQDETIIEVFTSNKNIIWLALNNGISKIEQNTPFRYNSESLGIKGNVYDICSFNQTLFVATPIGVFYQLPDQSFKKLEGIQGGVWSILPFNNQLLIGTELGLHVADKNYTVKYIDESIRHQNEGSKTNYIQKLYKSKFDQNTVFIASFDGVFSIESKGDSWKYKKEYPIKGFDIRDILEDNDGNIWFSTYLNSVIKYNKNNTDDIVFFNNEKGPSNYAENRLALINNKIHLGTKNGIWKYNANKNKFESDDILLRDTKISVNYLKQDKFGDVWLSAYNNQKKWQERLQLDTNGQVANRIITPFFRLGNEVLLSFYSENKNSYWLGTESGLFNYAPNNHENIPDTFHTLVRKVHTKDDSTLFYGTYYAINENGKRTPSLKQPEELVLSLPYELNDLIFEYAAPFYIEENKTLYSYKLEGNDKNWSTWSLETKAVFTNLGEGSYVFKVKAKNIYGTESTIGEYSFTITPPWYRTILAFIIYVILSLLLIIVIVKLYTRRLEQEKIRLEEIVQERTAEIREQNKTLEKQKTEILEQKEEITASIQYAQRIQKAIVPHEELAQCLLKNYFLLWKPRDIVSGDFWWLGEKEGYVVATAADCTGHGVPGAFMSMLGVSFLNEIVKQQHITNSGEILNRLREKVKTTLGQTDPNSTSKDGMDMGLLVIDFKNMKAQFSGAYNPLYLYRNGELIEYKATRNPIAVFIKEKPFIENDIDLQEGDTLYMFSDGFPDQFGGEKEKKYSTKRFKEYLGTIQNESMEKQREMLNNEIEDWMKDTHQIDDIIILGIRI